MLDILISTYEKEEHGIVIIVTINSFHKWKLSAPVQPGPAMSNGELDIYALDR